MEWDARPLAESFLVESAGGLMVSSIDLFFKTKSDSLPVSIEISSYGKRVS